MPEFTHNLLFFAGGFISGLILGLIAFNQCKRIALKLSTKKETRDEHEYSYKN